MAAYVSRALGMVLRDVRSRIILVVTSLTLIIFNIVSLIAVQWVISGEPPLEFGILSAPPESRDIALLWVKSGYYTPPGLTGDTYWIVFITPELFASVLAASILAGILFAELSYMSRIGGRCRIEKGAGSLGSLFIVFGSASATSSILSCPSCGFTLFTTVATITTASVTGTTFGLSSIAIKIAPYLMLVGALFNLGMIFYVSKKLSSVLS